MTADFVRTTQIPIVEGCLNGKVISDKGRFKESKEFIESKQFEEEECLFCRKGQEARQRCCRLPHRPHHPL